MARISLTKRIIGFVIILAMGAGLLSQVVAQDSTPAPFTITGTVEAVNATSLVVSGVTVDLSAANLTLPAVQVGVVVQITGSFTNGVIIATTVVIINPTVTPTPAVSATPTATATATFTPESTAAVTPSPTAIGTDDTIIIVEGPVQSININVITIFNIDIEVDVDDPILTQIEIGDMIHVEGHAVPQGTTIIIVAVNVTIVNVIIDAPVQGDPGLPPGCKITKKGKIKCSKKTDK